MKKSIPTGIPYMWLIAGVLLGGFALYWGVRLYSGHTVVGSGHAMKESRTIHNIATVHMEGAETLVIRQGDSESLTVEADDNLLRYIETNSENGVLRLTTRGANIQPKTPIRYDLQVKELQAIAVQGAGIVEGSGSFHSPDLVVSLDGASIATLDMVGKTLHVQLNGASKVVFSGSVENQDATLSGASQYDASALKSQKVQMSANGATEAKVHAERQLNAVVNGASQITYTGDPQLSIEVNGASSVRAQPKS
jgi:hypothetical protein